MKQHKKALQSILQEKNNGNLGWNSHVNKQTPSANSLC
jgi:hypothetical protein